VIHQRKDLFFRINSWGPLRGDMSRKKKETERFWASLWILGAAKPKPQTRPPSAGKGLTRGEGARAEKRIPVGGIGLEWRTESTTRTLGDFPKHSKCASHTDRPKKPPTKKGSGLKGKKHQGQQAEVHCPRDPLTGANAGNILLTRGHSKTASQTGYAERGWKMRGQTNEGGPSLRNVEKHPSS